MFPPEDDDVPTPPPLPDDRLWRHPSELAAEARGPAPTPGPARPRRLRTLVSVGVVSGLAGATVAVAALASMGALSSSAAEDLSSEPLSGPSTTVPLARAAATAVGPAVVELVVDDGNSLRHGSGVMVRADGLIVTCSQLLEGARRVTVRWPSGRQATATVSGSDPLTQLGALTVAGGRYPAATVDLTPLESGDEVVWVNGSPTDNRPLTTDITATGAHSDTADETIIGLIEARHQVPAEALGGAVVDLLGSLRGIAIGPSDDGTGRAVSAEVALRVADDLARLGRVDRGWLGVSGSPTPSGHSSLPAGLGIESVAVGSPAAAAGLTPGDDLISIDGVRVRSLPDVQSVLTLSRPGQTVALKVGRDDQQVDMRVTLGTDRTASPPPDLVDTEVATSDGSPPGDPATDTTRSEAPADDESAVGAPSDAAAPGQSGHEQD